MRCDDDLLPSTFESITNPTKLDALRTFIRTMDLDIVFLQEVENDQLSLPGFNVIANVDQTRGAAIALKDHIQFSHFGRSVDGRLVAVRVQNTTLCCVYVPSGTVYRTQRDFFQHPDCVLSPSSN